MQPAEAFTDTDGNGTYDEGEPFVDDNENGSRDPGQTVEIIFNQAVGVVWETELEEVAREDRQAGERGTAGSFASRRRRGVGSLWSVAGRVASRSSAGRWGSSTPRSGKSSDGRRRSWSGC